MRFGDGSTGVNDRRRARVAIVGAGLMGRWHAHYVTRQGAEVTAIVDPQSRVAAALRAEHPGAQTFTDLESCLGVCTVDVVHICTPAGTHSVLAATAIRAGKHVLIEKPLAPSLHETQEILDLAASFGVLVCPVHQFPFQRGCQRLQRDLHRLGDLIHVTFMTCSSGGMGRTAAERREILFEILPHPLSLFQHVLNVDLSQSGLCLTRLTEDELELNGSWNGTRLQAVISLRGRPTRNAFIVIGSGGTAHVDLFHGFSIIERGKPARRTKLLQPFTFGGKLLVAAQINLLRRIVGREFAYPGLPELITSFYRAIPDQAQRPFDSVELLRIATVIDNLRRTGANA